MAFHASSGRWRAWGRKLDYWAIALSSCCLTRALNPDAPPQLTLAAAAAIPFQPFLVSSANSVAMEVAFLARSFESPPLRRDQRIHSLCALASMALFALEDVFPQVPFMHASWHLLSTVCVRTTHTLVADAEARSARLLGPGRHPQLAGSPSNAPQGVSGSLSVHNSCSSLAHTLVVEPLKA